MAVQGLKYIRQIMAHPDMQQWYSLAPRSNSSGVQDMLTGILHRSMGEVSPGVNVTSDEDILEYASTTMIPNWYAMLERSTMHQI